MVRGETAGAAESVELNVDAWREIRLPVNLMIKVHEDLRVKILPYSVNSDKSFDLPTILEGLLHHDCLCFLGKV